MKTEMGGTNKSRKPRWKCLWGFSAFLEIANEYVADGDPDYFSKLAPFFIWVKALAKSLGFSVVLTICIYLAAIDFSVKSAQELQPAELALSVVPNLLGFGIGVYALIFGISATLLRDLQQHHSERAQGSSKLNTTILSLNAAFAFPLMVMVVTIIVASMQKAITTSSTLRHATWVLFFFSLILVYQLVATLFKLGRSVLIDKLDN